MTIVDSSDGSREAAGEHLLQAFTLRWLALLLGVPLTYAMVRYHVVQGVEWSHFPLYIANKALSLAAVILISTSFLIGKRSRIYGDEPDKHVILVKFCGQLGFSLATIHAMMALLLFSPDYYPQFFHETGKLNLVGELSMLFGVLSLWCLAMTSIASLLFMYDAIGADRWRRGQRLGYFSLLLAAGHVLVMGLSGWLAPTHWPGSMPPISLVAFIAAAVPLLIKLFATTTSRPRSHSAPEDAS